MRLELNDETMGVLDCVFKEGFDVPYAPAEKYNKDYMQLNPKNENVLCIHANSATSLRIMLDAKIKSLLRDNILVVRNRNEVEHLTELCQLTVGALIHTKKQLLLLQKLKRIRGSNERKITMITGHCTYTGDEDNMTLRQYFRHNIKREIEEEIHIKGIDISDTHKWIERISSLNDDMLTQKVYPLSAKHAGFIFNISVNNTVLDIISSGEPDKAKVIKPLFSELPEILIDMDDWVRSTIGDIPEIYNYYMKVLEEYVE